jgi:hypothetical protein
VGWTELTQDGGPVSIFCLHGDEILCIGNAVGLQQRVPFGVSGQTMSCLLW